MSIYAFPVLAVLAMGARVLAREHGNGVNLLAVRLVVVDKVARLALGARPTQEVVVAQLVRVLALLDRLHDGDVDGDGLVEAAGAGVPVGLLGRDGLVLGRAAGAGGGGGGRGAGV